MFDRRFPEHWTTNRKLIWLIGAVAQGASAIWKTVTGTLIHITDALASPMQKCEVSLEPIQDLHGQDSPYPAGGGKNRWNPTTGGSNSGTYNGITYTKNSDGSYTFKGTATTSTWINFGNITLPSGTWTASYKIRGTFDKTVYFGATTGAFTEYPSLSSYPRTVTSENETTGNFGINFPRNSTATDLTLWFQIEAGSSATPYAPYSNICPITGWTGCEVTRLGANILPYPYFDSSVTRLGITFTVNNDFTITVDGKATNDVVFELCRTYPYSNDELVLGKTITLTGCPQNGSQSTYYLSSVITGHKDTGNGVSFTINNVGYFRFAIVIKSGVTVNNLIFKPMVVVGTEQQDYEPYSGTTLSVTFPDSTGTVYGGTVDLVSGVLTVDRANVVYDGSSDEGWERYQQGSASAYAMRAQAPNRRESRTEIIAISNYLKGISASATWGNYDSFISIDFYNYRIITGLRTITTVEDWKTYLSTNNLQVVYELNEPIEIQLTPQEISTLKGVNNVWSNTNGDTTVIYKAQA